MKTTALIQHLTLLVCLSVFVLANPIKSLASQEKSYLLAQMDPDEAYDPFTDYSEFDEESDEEADINFFRNGRFLTLGLAAGSRGFTGGFAEAYGAAPTFGISLSYFFDLRLAMSLSFQTGDHPVAFTTNGGLNTYKGNLSLTAINFDLKYYMNTQNVTRGLADLNPYLLAGFGQFYRTYTFATNNLDGFSRDSAMGLDIGAGLEIPLMRKKAFLGIQATYHYVTFADENKMYIDNETLDRPLEGDFYNLLLIIGTNF